MPQDEERFSEELLIELPNVRFIDQDQYLKSMPSNLSISQCKSKWIYNWNKDVIPKPEVLSQAKKASQKYGYVLFFERSAFAPNTADQVLWSGLFSYSIEVDDFSDDTPIKFANTVSRILKKQNVVTLSCISASHRDVFRTNVKSYVIGNAVLQWCINHPAGLLRDRSAPNYYWPTPLLPDEAH